MPKGAKPQTGWGHAHDVGYLQGVSEGTEAERKRVLSKLLERHRPVGGEWGQSCGTCWTKGGSKAAWPCAESLAIGALLLDGEPT
jgi:hypothetical protein